VLRGAIFDLDGVLVDSHPVHMRAWKRFLLGIRKTANDQNLEFILEGRKREDILRHFLGDLTEEQVRFYGLQKELLFREEAKTIKTIPGVREFLNQLHQASIPMAVATCGGSDRVGYLLGVLMLREYFQVIVTGDDVKEGKPDPTIFNEAARRVGLRAEDLLAIEDSVSGVRAAKAAGMKCLGIAVPARAQKLREAGADWVLPNFLEASVDSFCEHFC
jgi:HAD superfamily hydrolase (TIGR01509 family)